MDLRTFLRAPSAHRVSEVWRAGHPWAAVYDFIVEHDQLGRPLWNAAMGTDVGLLHRAAAAIGELGDGGTVLDIPCGGGIALRGVRPEQAIRYVAADIAPGMLARTARRARELGLDQVETVAADVEDLPFADGTFDLCVSFTGLHCFPRPAAALREIGRCVRAGGRLSGSAVLNDTGVRFEPMRLAGRLTGLLGPSGTAADLERWLDEAGFEDAALRRSGAFVYFTATRAA
jgi:SAM-dependent methyltransferase